jgi:hypothetical protein
LKLAGVMIPTGSISLCKGIRRVEIGCAFSSVNVVLDASLFLWNWLKIRGMHNYDARHLRHAVDFLGATYQTFTYDRLVSPTYDFLDINHALRRSQGRDDASRRRDE